VLPAVPAEPATPVLPPVFAVELGSLLLHASAIVAAAERAKDVERKLDRVMSIAPALLRALQV
jgi:hypothetical protein